MDIQYLVTYEKRKFSVVERGKPTKHILRGFDFIAVSNEEDIIAGLKDSTITIYKTPYLELIDSIDLTAQTSFPASEFIIQGVSCDSILKQILPLNAPKLNFDENSGRLITTWGKEVLYEEYLDSFWLFEIARKGFYEDTSVIEDTRWLRERSFDYYVEILDLPYSIRFVNYGYIEPIAACFLFFHCRPHLVF